MAAARVFMFSILYADEGDAPCLCAPAGPVEREEATAAGGSLVEREGPPGEGIAAAEREKWE